MYKIVIIEDEKLAADNLARMILENEASCEIVAKIESVKEAVKTLPNISFDLVFMDVHLTDGSSFELLEKIELSQPIIFTTAFDQYVLKAFKYLSIDYLLKPIGKKELDIAIKKFQNHFSHHSNKTIDLNELGSLLNKGSNFKDRFLVQIGKKLKPISIAQILFFHSSHKITFLTIDENKSYPIDASLSQLEKELNPNEFFRINRQYIISRKEIHHIYMASPTKMKVILRSKPDLSLFISIDRMGKFKRWMK